MSDTYSISAKMINIKTGVIANQTSAEGEGKLSSLIDLAAQVGEVLSGGAVTALSSTGTPADISKPAAPATTETTVPPPAPMPAPAKEKLKTIWSYQWHPSGDMTDSSGKSIVSGSGGGIDAHVLIPLFGGFPWSVAWTAYFSLTQPRRITLSTHPRVKIYD